MSNLKFEFSTDRFTDTLMNDDFTGRPTMKSFEIERGPKVGDLVRVLSIPGHPIAKVKQLGSGERFYQIFVNYGNFPDTAWVNVNSCQLLSKI